MNRNGRIDVASTSIVVTVQSSGDSVSLSAVYFLVWGLRRVDDFVFAIDDESNLHVETDKLGHGHGNAVERIIVDEMGGPEAHQSSMEFPLSISDGQSLFDVDGEGGSGSSSSCWEVELTEVDAGAFELPVLVLAFLLQFRDSDGLLLWGFEAG